MSPLLIYLNFYNLCYGLATLCKYFWLPFYIFIITSFHKINLFAWNNTQRLSEHQNQLAFSHKNISKLSHGPLIIHLKYNIFHARSTTHFLELGEALWSANSCRYSEHAKDQRTDSRHREQIVPSWAEPSQGDAKEIR